MHQHKVRGNYTYKFVQFPITARYLQIHVEEISGIETTTEGKTEPVYRHEHAKHSVISPDDGVLLQQLNSALSEDKYPDNVMKLSKELNLATLRNIGMQIYVSYFRIVAK